MTVADFAVPLRQRVHAVAEIGWKRRLRWIAGVLLLAGLLQQAVTWPSVGALAQGAPAGTAFMARERARLTRAGEDPALVWTWVPATAIAPSMKLAVLVAEDQRFFEHNGFDAIEIRASLAQAWHERHLPRGASTLSQQLARNLWLSPSRDPLRKMKEALLTMQLERALTKDRILELYLNVVQFGPGVFGVEAASQRYFGKPASELTDLQAADLAAALPAPDQWYPGADSDGYRARIADIAARMQRASVLRARVTARSS